MTRKHFNRLAEAVRTMQFQSEFTEKQFEIIILQMILACEDLAKGEFDRATFVNACRV